MPTDSKARPQHDLFRVRSQIGFKFINDVKAAQQAKSLRLLDHNNKQQAMPPKSKKAKKPSKQHPPADEEPPEEEDEKDDLWRYHPAREILLDALWNGDIPLDYNRQPVTIYNKFKDHEAFEGMPYDATFQRRLLKLRDIVKKKKNRLAEDEIAFDIFRKNFPVRQVNAVGVLRWHGSLAQYYLKQDMKAGKHEGITPAEFQDTRPEYEQYPTKTFRKHIHQERRLWKLEHYLEVKAQKDAAKVAKKVQARAKKKAKAKEKAKKKSEQEKAKKK